MLKDITLGQFFPGDSALHRLDPRTKILLTIVFIVLKLCKVISWSWLWVLAPIWIPAAIGITVLIVYVIVSLVTAIFRK